MDGRMDGNKNGKMGEWMRGWIWCLNSSMYGWVYG